MRVLVPDEAQKLFQRLPDAASLEPVFYRLKTQGSLARILRRLDRLRSKTRLKRFIEFSQPDLRHIEAAWLSPSCRFDKAVSTAFLDGLPSLKWVFSQATGTDHLPLDVYNGRGVKVSNSGDMTSRWVSEMIVAAVLAFIKRLPEHASLQRRARWEYLESREFAGIRVGIIGGTGNIARETATMCRALGLHVTGTSRDPSNLPLDLPFDRVVHTFKDLPLILEESDVVVLSLPLTRQTGQLLGEKELGRMKPGAALVNYGRAGLIDERAVKAALSAGRLGAFYTDFLHDRSLPGRINAARTPNFFLTHDSAANCPGRLERAAARFVAGVKQLRDGRHPVDIVNSHSPPEHEREIHPQA